MPLIAVWTLALDTTLFRVENVLAFIPITPKELLFKRRTNKSKWYKLWPELLFSSEEYLPRPQCRFISHEKMAIIVDTTQHD